MSVVRKENQSSLQKNLSSVSEVFYTICPVLVASHIAVEKGWLEQELNKTGITLKYLWSLPLHNWLAHFTHGLPNLFRDGGNIPAIWTKAAGKNTKLVGLTFAGNGGQLLVRIDSGIQRVSDLKGKRIGLYKRVIHDRIDFFRATGERGIELILELSGLKKGEVEILDLPEEGPDYPSTEPFQKPAERWSRSRTSSHYQVEAEALLNGKVDAIYSNHGRSQALQAGGKLKVIEDLAKYPDWTLQVANSPYTITINSELAEEYPEVVVAYLTAAVRAGRWANNHPLEAAEIFAKVTSFWSSDALAKELPKYNLIPNLSPQNISGIEVEKKFLLEHGYINGDFAVNDWIDNSFLLEAITRAEDYNDSTD